MKRGTKDAVWATALAVAVTALITWREVAREARGRGQYR
jgi:hypothetical protein